MNPLKTLGFTLTLTTAALLLSLVACKKDFTGQTESTNQNDQPGLTGLNGNTICSQKTVALCAGKNANIGSVVVETNPDGSTLITYLIHKDAPWVFKEVQLYAGAASEMPTTKAGSPNAGAFPYKATFDPKTGVKKHSFLIQGLPKSYTVAAHATVVRANSSGTATGASETAWGDGCGGTPMKTSGGGWGTMFDYTAESCQNLEEGSSSDGSGVPQICAKAQSSFFNAETALDYETWPDSNGEVDEWGTPLNNGKVTVGGYHYSEQEGEAILLAASVGSDEARSGFMAVATLRLSYTATELDTELNGSVVLVEDWLQVLGKLSERNLTATDNTNVKNAIAYINNWISQHPCPGR